jgi:hypothetical protein
MSLGTFVWLLLSHTRTQTGFQNVSPHHYYPHGNDIAGKMFYEGKVSKPKKKDSTSFT